jgi:hypothetical protein
MEWACCKNGGWKDSKGIYWKANQEEGEKKED